VGAGSPRGQGPLLLREGFRRINSNAPSLPECRISKLGRAFRRQGGDGAQESGGRLGKKRFLSGSADQIWGEKR